MANTLKFGNGEWYGNKDTILAYNDENSNFKPLPFSFDRASSATRVNKDGLIETVGSGEPRIDYKDDSKGALLLEPSRSNLVTYSNEFTNSSVWGSVNTTFTDNETQSPSGLLTGKLTRNVTTFSCIRDTTVSTVLGTTYVFSAFYKKDTETTINHGVLNQNTGYVTFNFDTETISITRNDNSNSISSDGFGFEKYANGWYRIYLKFVRKAGSLQLQVARQDSGVIGQSTFIYGAQLEQGSYPTSYIPTQGGAVTRVAESCSQTPPDGVIGQTEGTMYAEVKINGLKNSNTITTLHNGSFSEYLVIAGNSSGNINAYIFAGGVQQAGILSGIYAVDSIIKCAMAYKENDVAFYINGVLIGTDSSATMASTSVFDVGSISFGDYPLNGSVKQAKLYNTRLSNNELQALTTI